MYEARTGTAKDLRKLLENLPEDAQLTLMAPINLDGTSVLDGHPKQATSIVLEKGKSKVVDDLSMLMRRLVRSIKKTDPNNELANKALDYLLQIGQISPLRETQPGVETTGEPINAMRTIDHGPEHAVRVAGDNETCYPKRAEWVQSLLKLADKAERNIEPPASNTDAGNSGISAGETQCACLACIKRYDLRSETGLPLDMTRMIVCSVCGHKRCVHAKNHEAPCAKSDIYAHNTWIEENMIQKE